MLTESGGSPIGRVLTDEEQERLFKVAASNAEWQHVCRAVAPPQAPTRDARERRIDGARPIFSSAGDRTEPPSGRRETGVAIGRNGGLRFGAAPAQRERRVPGEFQIRERSLPVSRSW
jgi:hypothetical protein